MATANERIRQGIVQHQVGLIRVGNSLRRRVLAHLRRTEADMRRQIADRAQRIASTDDTPVFLDPVTQSRLSRLERSIRASRNPAFDAILGDMRSELTEIAVAEPEFLTNLIRQVSPVDLPLRQPDPNELSKIVTSRPFQGRILRQWTIQLAVDERRRIMNEIRIGLTQGQTATEITRRIVGTQGVRGADGITHLTRNHVQTLVRTAINHIGSAARREFALANARLFRREQWVSVLDSRTSHICLDLNGQLFPIGKGIHPPAHFNSLAQGTLIETERGPAPIERVKVGERVLTHRGRMMPVTAVMAKPCDHADILRIETSSGNVVLITDEHPVLAAGRGWISADQVEPGDKLFENPEQESRLEGTSCVVGHANDYPSPFDQPLVPYEISVEPGSVAASIDLDRNKVVGQSEVDSAPIDDDLMPDVYRAGPDKILPADDVEKRPFGFGDVIAPRLGLSDSDSMIDLWIERGVDDLHSLATSVLEILPFTGSLPTPMVDAAGPIDMSLAGLDAFNLGPDRDPIGLAEVGHFPRLESDIFGDASEGSALAPVLDVDKMAQGRRVNHWKLSDVISITRLPYNSPLYHLSVDTDETYVAEGIVVHNCRSIRAPFIDENEAIRHRVPADQARAQVREFARLNGLGRVTSRRQLNRTQKREFDAFQRRLIREQIGALPPVMSTEDFLGGLADDALEDVLGVTKARLFERGGLSIGRLVDREGQPLSLAALARKEADAFRRANLNPMEFNL